MSSLSSVSTTLRIKAGSMLNSIPVGDQTAALESFVSSALSQLFPDKDIADLTAAEDSAVALLAHVYLCYRVASDSVLSYEMDSPEGSGKPSQVVDNAVKLASKLTDELEDSLKTNGLSGKYNIQVVDVTRRDIFNGLTPYNGQVVRAEHVSLFSARVVGTDLEFTWTPDGSSRFTAYHLFKKSSPGIRNQADSCGAFNGVSSDAEKIKTIVTRFSEGTIISKPSAGTWYFMLVTEHGQGNFAYSDEVGVTVT